MSKKKATILLVEDDVAQVMMYEAQFVNEGYKVITAKNEEGALNQLKQKPDLIFLDLLLGNSNGLDILKKIKSNKETKDFKVIILTNFQKNGLKNEAVKLGALDYLVKSSLVPKDLVEKAKKYIEAV